MLFDVLSDILFNKREDQLQSVDNEADVNPYMLNRWISMHSPESAFIVNEYNNRWWSVLQNKNDWYRFCLTVIPKYRYTKLSYIKKASKEKKVVMIGGDVEMFDKIFIARAAALGAFTAAVLDFILV